MLVAANALPAIPQAPPSAPPLAPDPVVAALVAQVSTERLRATDVRLVGFGTRNLFSERSSSSKRGVYAARDWLAARFRDAGRGSGGRLSVSFDTYMQPKTERTPREVEVSSVIATLRGDDPDRATYVMSSHYDSRNSDGNDALLDAPGADDNGSGTSAVLEAARVMAPAHFRGTIVFACFDGEEQGLFGSGHFAKTLAMQGVRVGADLNNDIIGASVGHDGESAPYEVRLFSEALAAGADPQRVNVLGNENDSPARELARFTKETGEAYVPSMHVDLIYRSDRFLRGGDQQSFAAVGFPAVRYVEAHENFDHQHQTVRIADSVQYGDLLRYVDFDYLARVTQLNVAALATLALAPPPPASRLLAKTLGYDTTLAWDPVPGAAAYEIVWRRTDESVWTHAQNVSDVSRFTLPLAKDDWLFGVRSVDGAGRRSVAAFPVPDRT
jgi:Zn-dependent M28 family amino/carboxypeptidase